jgi:2'-5' RNA ligase
LPERNEHLVVVMVESATQKEFEIWPLHITLVPWFPCDNASRLDSTLKQIANKHKPFKVRTARVEEWGSEDKFIVQLIEDEEKIHDLHNDVYQKLENNGYPIHQKDYLGDKYKPHLTLRSRYQKSHKMPEGTEITIDKIALIKQIRLKRTGTMIKSVAKEYKLNG